MLAAEAAANADLEVDEVKPPPKKASIVIEEPEENDGPTMFPL